MAAALVTTTSFSFCVIDYEGILVQLGMNIILVDRRHMLLTLA